MDAEGAAGPSPSGGERRSVVRGDAGATGCGGGDGEVRGLLERHPLAAEAVAGLLAPVGSASR